MSAPRSNSTNSSSDSSPPSASTLASETSFLSFCGYPSWQVGWSSAHERRYYYRFQQNSIHTSWFPPFWQSLHDSKGNAKQEEQQRHIDEFSYLACQPSEELGLVSAAFLNERRSREALRLGYRLIAFNVFQSSDVNFVEQNLFNPSVQLPPPLSYRIPKNNSSSSRTSELTVDDWNGKFTFLEDSPALAVKRKECFDYLDEYLSELCRQAGRKEGQITNAFKRWGFIQRLLDAPLFHRSQGTDASTASTSSQPQAKRYRPDISSALPSHCYEDPLIPSKPSVDIGLIGEMMRDAKLPHSVAYDIAAKLAIACEEQAIVLKEFLDQRCRLLGLAQLNSQQFSEAFAERFSSEGRVQLIDTRSEIRYRLQYEEKSSNDEIEISDDDTKIPLKYSMDLHEQHYLKLRRLYESATEVIDSPESEARFLRRLFCLVGRYDTLAAAGYQAACPEQVFDTLRSAFSITHECFASPLNCYLPAFGSAFYDDCDRFFGSSGSFFDCRFSSGFYESNPPFTEELMIANALHCVALLVRAESQSLPLAFAVIWPAWEDSPCFDLLTKHELVKKYNWLKKKIRLGKHQHTYKEGAQHRSIETYRQSTAPSNVFFLQTTQAAKKWPITREFEMKFVDAFKKSPDELEAANFPYLVTTNGRGASAASDEVQS